MNKYFKKGGKLDLREEIKNYLLDNKAVVHEEDDRFIISIGEVKRGKIQWYPTQMILSIDKELIIPIDNFIEEIMKSKPLFYSPRDSPFKVFIWELK